MAKTKQKSRKKQNFPADSMNRKAILKVAEKALGGRVTQVWREPGYVLSHGLRVANLSVNLCRQVDTRKQIDLDVLFVAALFHDVGKGIEPHGVTGATLIPTLLKEYCERPQLVKIARIVREHNCRGAERCLLASKIVQDADMIDHYGAQSPWLVFHWNAHFCQPPEEAIEYYWGRKNQKDIKKSRALLNFEISREVFDRRISIEEAFFRQFESELKGEL